MIQTYLYLTKVIMPQMAKSSSWIVRHDHCFQRIVLDNICGGVWYDHVKKPAIHNLSPEQIKSAVYLCEKIVDGTADLNQLNQNSLVWRGKRV